MTWGGAEPWRPPPSQVPHRAPSQEGSSLLPTLLGNHSREASLPQTPKSPVPALCVCAHERAREALGAAECMGAPCVPDWSAVPGPFRTWGGGLQQCVRGARMGVCHGSTPPLPKKVRGTLGPAVCPVCPSRAASLVKLCCWDRLPGALGGNAPPPTLGFWGDHRGPLESGHHRPWGEAKTPEDTPAPLTVTPHTQQ